MTKVTVIGASVETSVLLDIARLAPGSGISFVCLGKAGAQWMASRMREAGIEGFMPAWLGWIIGRTYAPDRGIRSDLCI